MLVTVPCLLLLLDIWPLGRWTLGPRRLVVEKLPFFALASAACVLTVVAQGGGNAFPDLAWLPLHTRILNAAAAYVFYVEKTIWPTGLAVYYPHARNALSVWTGLASIAVLLLVTALVLVARRRRPYLAVGWLWYLGMLVPVIGLVQVGGQAMADRYTYLPSIGLFVALGWGARDLAALHPRERVVVPLCVVFTLLLAASTWQQVGRWRNSETLFEHTLAVTEKNIRVHDLLGLHLAGQNRLEAAIAQYRRALAIEPRFTRARYHLGAALAKSGELGAAEAELIEVLRLDPNDARARRLLALVQAKLQEASEGGKARSGRSGTPRLKYGK
jgi:tetratricopeptide (TPR) repeat protein